MKKIYFLMLATVATVGSLSATATQAIHKVTEGTCKIEKLAAPKEISASSILRAPASQAATGAPASLASKSCMVNFSIIEDGNTFNVSNIVSFSNEQEEDGVLYYTMTNFLNGMYDAAVNCPDLEVAYIPSENALLIPGQQIFVSLPLKDGTMADCQMWMANATGNCVCTNAVFFYADGTFTLENPFEVNYEDGTSETFTASTILMGRVTAEGKLGYYIQLGAEMSYTPIDGSGQMKFTMNGKDTNTGADKIQNFTANVAASLNGNILTIRNFADMADVPMTIDTNAKTLTATKVEIIIPDFTSHVYLSAQAADGTNAAGNRQYVLTSTYTVEGGKTNISVPNWNGYYYTFSEGEQYYFWPLTDTSIVLDFDLDESLAGVDAVVADGEFDANATVEYFNLQGIRVATPEAGQLLIKRQGNKAEKVVIR